MADLLAVLQDEPIAPKNFFFPGPQLGLFDLLDLVVQEIQPLFAILGRGQEFLLAAEQAADRQGNASDTRDISPGTPISTRGDISSPLRGRLWEERQLRT